VDQLANSNTYSNKDTLSDTDSNAMRKCLYTIIFFIILLSIPLAACTHPSSPTSVEDQFPTAITLPTKASTATPPIPTADPIDVLLEDLQGTPVRFVVPTQISNSGPDWRPPPYDPPLALRPEDHFYFARPIPSGEVNWPNPTYRYGNTFFTDTTVHTGVDLGADQGADVLAAGSGEVVWVGYGLYRGYEDPNDPYGLAIAIRHDFGHKGKQLYTIYAHLEDTAVWLGQRVQTGDKIGSVGITGHTTGPHLHFEVRLGDNDYYATRNPELWMVPPEGWAVLAGRVTNSYGHYMMEQMVEITSLVDGQTWTVKTYKHSAINVDDIYKENFVISDLPSGPYEININYYGVNMKTQLFLYPGRTNFIEFKGWSGYTLEDNAEVGDLIDPPVQ
jgi:murein DD-endopeptidase MepM/ murein hydrolase activator NlpD